MHILLVHYVSKTLFLHNYSITFILYDILYYSTIKDLVISQNAKDISFL